jgi:hypothetical protein
MNGGDMPGLQLLVESTPNPHAAKLTLNREIGPEGRTYRDAVAADVPWAKALLSIAGVIGVYGINNFISIHKQPDADWDTIIPQAKTALERVFA